MKSYLKGIAAAILIGLAAYAVINGVRLGEIIVWILAVMVAYVIISMLCISIYGIIKKEDWAKGLKGCLLFYIVLFIVIPTIAFSIKQCKDEPKEKDKTTIEQLQNKENGEVYICTGRYAKKYHRRPNCRGLNNCKGGVRKVELEKVNRRRTPCHICY